MKKITFSYDRFVLFVWVFFLAVFFVRHLLNGMTLLEGFLLAAWYVGASYPITTYLTKNLLKKAIEKRNGWKFAFQFLIFSSLFSFAIPIAQWTFYTLENEGVFPVSGFFDYLKDRGASIDDFIAGFQVITLVNFGFCGLRFFEINMQMREELSRSRLQMLQAQINPHFMFNVLNHVHVLIRKEPELADALLLKYTGILRYQLYNGDKESITIGQEVQFLKNFIDVEAVRWKNKLNIDCRWEVEDFDMEIPPLLFITFVENAFKHVSRSNMQKGYVNITLIQKGKTIFLEVENSNVDAALPKKYDSGIGLANIKRRLDILYPGKYSLETDNNDVFYSTKLCIN